MKKKRKEQKKQLFRKLLCIAIGIIASYAVAMYIGVLAPQPSSNVYEDLEEIIEPLKEDYNYSENNELLASLGINNIVSRIYRDSFVIETVSPENRYAEVDVVFDKEKNFTKTVWVCTQFGHRTYSLFGPKADIALLHTLILIFGVVIGDILSLIVRFFRL